MNRNELLLRVADEVSIIVAGALAATGEDDPAYWDLVQKLRHKYALPLLTEVEVQAGVRQYQSLTLSLRPTFEPESTSRVHVEFLADPDAVVTRADRRALVLVEAVLSSEGTVTRQTVQDTDHLLTQLGYSLDTLYAKGLLSKKLLAILEASGYTFAVTGRKPSQNAEL